MVVPLVGPCEPKSQTASDSVYCNSVAVHCEATLATRFVSGHRDELNAAVFCFMLLRCRTQTVLEKKFYLVAPYAIIICLLQSNAWCSISARNVICILFYAALVQQTAIEEEFY